MLQLGAQVVERYTNIMLNIFRRADCHLQSSLTLALLRCILTEGNVYYDGLPTNSLNLDALRSNITIIPQVARNILLFLSFLG